jgi:hypothetical protein
MLAEAGSDDEIVVEVEKMTREAGNYGGDHSDYGAQHQVRRVFPADAEDEESSGYRDNRLRQNFFRVGHVARGSHRDPVAGVPGAGGRGPARPEAVTWLARVQGVVCSYYMDIDS